MKQWIAYDSIERCGRRRRFVPATEPNFGGTKACLSPADCRDSVKIPIFMRI